MLRLLTTDAFAEWFEALADPFAEEVATSLEIVERLGPARAAPGSRESLLWYEHPSAARFDDPLSLASWLEAWGSFRDYAYQVLGQLESRRFVSRLTILPAADANAVIRLVRRIKTEVDPRARWTRSASRTPLGMRSAHPEDAHAELRRLYFAVLEAAGFDVADVPAHSLALRELARRLPAPGFRLLYGVDAERETALVVLGEWLDRSFYGDSVHRAERTWKQFLDATMRGAEPAQLR